MSRKRTRLQVLFFVLLAAQGAVVSASSFPSSPSERVQVFATCAGRYSALAEHQRFFDGAASERAQETQRVFEELLEATLPAAIDWGMPGRQALTWRVSAKVATSQLLHSSTFSPDDRHKAIAQEAAQGHLKECEGLVFGT